MQATDELPPAQIKSVTLYVYKGDLEYDADGKITNELTQVVEYTKEAPADGHRNER